jgi:hypothetical protein
MEIALTGGDRVIVGADIDIDLIVKRFKEVKKFREDRGLKG